MKVLILSCNNGGGHNSVAAALREAFEAEGHVCEIADTLSFLSRGCSKVVAGVHSGVYRHAPDLFRAGYRHTERHRVMFQPGHRARRILDLGVGRLAACIRDGRFDAVVCTHVFAATMLTDAVRRHGLRVTTGVVETDYTNTPGVEASELDWYFVPSPVHRLTLSELGVPEEKIVASGIPVRRQMFVHHSQEEARRALGLNPARRQLLVVSGSMGCGPIPELIEAVLAKKDEDLDVTVACSTNERLRKELMERYIGRKDVHVLGHVEDMSLLMDTADVYLTKPGGISTTEAAVKGLPLVLMNTVGGCESYNLQFFQRAGAAWSGESVEQLADAAVCLGRSAALRERLKEGLTVIASGNRVERIVQAMTCRQKSPDLPNGENLV